MKSQRTKYFRVKYSKDNNEKVVYIFSAMGTKIWMYSPLIMLLRLYRYSVVVYEYDTDILFNAEFKEWDRFYEEVISDSKSRIIDMKQNGTRHFYSYGFSMGTLLANKLAREEEYISHIILNLTYGDVAEQVWGWRGTKRVKDGLMNKNLTLDDLKKNYEHIDPIKTAADLKGKKVLLQLSRRDRVLPYKDSIKTKLAFEEAQLDFTYDENRIFGHYLTGFTNSLRISRISRFYKS